MYIYWNTYILTMYILEYMRLSIVIGVDDILSALYES